MLFIVSCNSTKKTSKEELSRFSINSDPILYDGKFCAKYTELEWEYYRGKKTLEISVEKIGGFDNMANSLMDYMRTRYPKAKIEVKLK